MKRRQTYIRWKREHWRNAEEGKRVRACSDRGSVWLTRGDSQGTEGVTEEGGCDAQVHTRAITRARDRRPREWPLTLAPATDEEETSDIELRRSVFSLSNYKHGATSFQAHMQVYCGFKEEAMYLYTVYVHQIAWLTTLLTVEKELASSNLEFKKKRLCQWFGIDLN